MSLAVLLVRSMTYSLLSLSPLISAVEASGELMLNELLVSYIRLLMAFRLNPP